MNVVVLPCTIVLDKTSSPLKSCNLLLDAATRSTRTPKCSITANGSFSAANHLARASYCQLDARGSSTKNYELKPLFPDNDPVCPLHMCGYILIMPRGTHGTSYAHQPPLLPTPLILSYFILKLGRDFDAGVPHANGLYNTL